jgi:hypothetical protein
VCGSTKCSLIGLLLVLHELRGDPIHVSDALLGKGLSRSLLAAVLRLVLDETNETSILKLLQAVSDHFTGTLVVLGGADTVSLLATVVRLQSRHTNLASDVELVSNGGSSGVQPVGFVWGKILERSSLNVLGPLYSMGLRFHLEVTEARVSLDVRTSY